MFGKNRRTAESNRNNVGRLARYRRLSALAEMLETRILLSTAKIAAISDYGWTGDGESPGQGIVASMIDRWNVNTILTSGDNWQGSYASTNPYGNSVGHYYSDYVNAGKFFPAPGNHDWAADGNNTLNYYNAYFNYLPYPTTDPDYVVNATTHSAYYDVVIDPVHLFVVDSDSNDPGGRTTNSHQYNWLQRRLQSSTSPWNIVVFHEPGYTDGLSHTPNTDMRWPFKTWGADAVITGHVHNYERFNLGGMPYFVNGVGGWQNSIAFNCPLDQNSWMQDNGHFGGILITADDSSITFTFTTTDGTTDTVRDTVTLTGPQDSVVLNARGGGWTYRHPLNGQDPNLPGNWYTSSYSPPVPPWVNMSAGSPDPVGYGALGPSGNTITPRSIGLPSSGLRYTAYFRKTFAVSDLGAIKSLVLNMLRDDGAAVYLNGQEVYRTSNLASNATHFTLTTGAAVGDEDERKYFSNVIDCNSLQSGSDNLLAVEVHQRTTDSSDLGLDIELVGLTQQLKASFYSGTGTLIVEGTEDDDTITISADANGHVTLNGTAIPGPVAASSVQNIAVFGFNGIDAINLSDVKTDKGFGSGSSPRVTVLGGGGNDTITGSAFADLLDGGDDNDSITAGDGDDTILSSAGNDSIDGGLGDDVLTITGTAAVTFSATQILASLSVGDSARATLTAGGGKVIRTNALTIAAAATLDLNDNDMIVRTGNVTTISNYIRSARNGGAWTGTGLTSTTAKTTNCTTLAATLNNKGDGALIKETFAGQDVYNTDVLVKYTYDGDAQLDGVVNADDYFLIDAGFITQAPGYYHGDFNYDGVCNADDYFLIDSAFFAQGQPLNMRSGGDPSAKTGQGTALLDSLPGLTIDLREHTTGSKQIQITAVGQVIYIDVFATVRGVNAEQYQALDIVEGSFLASSTGQPVVTGLLRAYVASAFQLQGYSNGTPQDLNSDGQNDVGGTDPDSAAGYFIARSGGAIAAEAGVEYTWLIGTVKFRVNQIAPGGGQVEINFAKRGDLAESMLWYEDGDPVNLSKNGTSEDFHIGSPVVLTYP